MKMSKSISLLTGGLSILTVLALGSGPFETGPFQVMRTLATPADRNPKEKSGGQNSLGLDSLRLGSRTLGGRFIWSDEVVFHGWRIQKNAVIGHYRLLDDRDRRHARGSLETCLTKLDEIKQTKKLPPMPPKVVIVLHGLVANRQMMAGLADFLKNKGKLTTVNVGYPSTMASIEEHALSLASVIQHLEGVREISFVAHSMGNLVIRHYLNDIELLTPAARPKVQFKRFVMISPPNHGATMAGNFADSKLVQAAAGESLQQLAPNRKWPELEKRLATPNFDFGIIAGGTGDRDGYLQALPGDDDSLLTLETTKLAGASDFVQVKGIHQLLPQSKQVRLVTLRFLLKGYFISPQQRHPLPAARSVVQVGK
jgi:pimeloyl-ACP methyl ester carboxylesterase